MHVKYIMYNIYIPEFSWGTILHDNCIKPTP